MTPNQGFSGHSSNRAAGNISLFHVDTQALGRHQVKKKKITEFKWLSTGEGWRFLGEAQVSTKANCSSHAGAWGCVGHFFDQDLGSPFRNHCLQLFSPKIFKSNLESDNPLLASLNKSDFSSTDETL